MIIKYLKSIEELQFPKTIIRDSNLQLFFKIFFSLFKFNIFITFLKKINNSFHFIINQIILYLFLFNLMILCKFYYVKNKFGKLCVFRISV